jgi:hypothetical protein
LAINADLVAEMTSPRREYVGLSGIGHCLREQYWRFVDPEPLDVRMARYSRAGYLHEHEVKRRLRRIGVISTYRGAEVVAPFDPRLRGHTDGETVWGDLLEIKSTNDRRFREVMRTGGPLPDHAAQVHMYLRYGPWSQALMVYINRCDHQYFPMVVPYDAAVGDAMELRAKELLRAIDLRTPPACTCGCCGR